MDCDVITSVMDKSEVDLHVQVSANSQLMCAVQYLIQFDGENKTVPVGSPSVNFTIDNEREKYFLKGMLYTVDNESRIGQNPCSFNIPGKYQFHCVYIVENRSFTGHLIPGSRSFSF